MQRKVALGAREVDLYLVSVPYRYDEPNQGLGGGPAALIDTGLEKAIGKQGISIRQTLTANLDPADRAKPARDDDDLHRWLLHP